MTLVVQSLTEENDELGKQTRRFYTEIEILRQRIVDYDQIVAILTNQIRKEVEGKTEEVIALTAKIDLFIADRDSARSDLSKFQSILASLSGI